MKGFLVFSKLNDLLHWQLDEELTRHFAVVAQKQGLAAVGEPKYGKRTVKLSKDALVHLFSPLVTTQRIMGLQLRNPYVYVKFPSGVGLAFEEVYNCSIICVGSSGEDELKRKAVVVRQVVEFLFGPSFETLKSRSSLHDSLNAMVLAWDELRDSNLGFLIEAVERCQITPAANRVVVEVLRDALKTVGDQAPSDTVKPTHAFLLAGTKLVALYSRRGQDDLCASDFLFIVLLVQATLSPPADIVVDASEDRFVSHVVMLSDPITGEHSVPRYVYAVPVFGDVALVIVCESRKDELSTAFVSCLRSLDAMLKTKASSSTPNVDLGTEIERILILAKKIGTPSPELARFQRNLGSQWDTARRNGFDSFVKDYKSASVRVRQAHKGDAAGERSSPSSSHPENHATSLRSRFVRFESLLAVIVGTLQEGFGLCCLDDFNLKDGLDCLSEFVGTHAISQLGDFSDFLRFKAGQNIDLVAYLEEFPTLVHFIYVDRRTNQVVSPGRMGETLEGEESPFWRKLRKAIGMVRAHVARGNHTVIWRDKSFVYSYHLWFENASGEPLLPRRESRHFAGYLPYPGVIGNNFYNALARESFSASRPSTSSVSSPPQMASGRAPRVIVKELYCFFSGSASSSSSAGNLAAEDALVQAQRVAECLPSMLSSMDASPAVAFL